MDKNEYKVRLEEIRHQIDQGNTAQAAVLADQIDWKKVRNVNTLCMISEVYEAEGRCEDSKALLLRAYRKSPMSRTVLYRLVEVTIALKQFDEAIGYYTEYVQAAPHDMNRYILKYKIYRGRGSSVNEQIDILKEYLDQEYNEKYAYELARLYKEADRMEECIAACDDLVLWFHSGKYVIKALELKKKYAALTPKQQEIYDSRFAMEDAEEEQEPWQEKKMVGTDETTLADTIMEDTERSIAEEIAKAARGEDVAGEQPAAEPDPAVSSVERDLQATRVLPARGTVAAAGAAVKDAAGGAAEAAAEVVEGAAGAAKNAAGGAAEAAAEVVENAAGAAEDAAEELAGDLTGGAEDTVGTLEKLVENAVKAAEDTGEEMTETAAGAAKDAAEELAGDLTGGAEDTAGTLEKLVENAAGKPSAATAQAMGETLDEMLAGAPSFREVREDVRRAKAAGTEAASGAAQVLKGGTQQAKSAVESARGEAENLQADAEKVRQEAEENARGAAQSLRAGLEKAKESGAEAAQDAVRFVNTDAQKAKDALSETARETDWTLREEPETEELPEEEPAGTADADPEQELTSGTGQSTQQLQSEIARDMREVIGNVGRLEYVNETEQAMDDLIEESKLDLARERENQQLRMPSLRMPDLQRKQAAGKLTIDDVLLSMGERGQAVRDAAARATPGYPGRPGVLSAVDEALLGMGIRPAGMEEEKDETKTEEPGQTPERREVTASPMTEILPETNGDQEVFAEETAQEASGFDDTAKAGADLANESGKEAGTGEETSAAPSAEAADLPEEDVKEAVVHRSDVSEEELKETAQGGETDSQDGSFRDKTMEEIIAARTRRMPTEEIARKYGARPLNLEDLNPDDMDTDALAGRIEAQLLAEETPGLGADRTKSGEKEPDDGAKEDRGEGGRSEEQNTKDADDASAGNGASSEQTSGAVAAGPRLLKDELRELFDGFLNVRGMEAQIATAIRQTLAKGSDRTSRSGNILIFGGHGAGKTTLAMALARAIAQEQGKEYVKMARIYSTDLNRKDIAATIAKIAGGVLIVEEAGDLDDGIADQMTTAMEFRTDGLVVILEDEQAYIHDLLMRHPRLTMKFTSQIYIPEYTTEDLVGFGALYADDRDYAFSPEGSRKLAENLSAMASQGEPLSITNVLDRVDAAIARANKFGRKLFSGKKRFDSEGRVLLLEKDFR